MGPPVQKKPEKPNEEARVNAGIPPLTQLVVQIHELVKYAAETVARLPTVKAQLDEMRSGLKNAAGRLASNPKTRWYGEEAIKALGEMRLDVAALAVSVGGVLASPNAATYMSREMQERMKSVIKSREPIDEDKAAELTFEMMYDQFRIDMSGLRGSFASWGQGLSVQRKWINDALDKADQLARKGLDTKEDDETRIAHLELARMGMEMVMIYAGQVEARKEGKGGAEFAVKRMEPILAEFTDEKWPAEKLDRLGEKWDRKYEDFRKAMMSSGDVQNTIEGYRKARKFYDGLLLPKGDQALLQLLQKGRIIAAKGDIGAYNKWQDEFATRLKLVGQLAARQQNIEAMKKQLENQMQGAMELTGVGFLIPAGGAFDSAETEQMEKDMEKAGFEPAERERWITLLKQAAGIMATLERLGSANGNVPFEQYGQVLASFDQARRILVGTKFMEHELEITQAQIFTITHEQGLVLTNVKVSAALKKLNECRDYLNDAIASLRAVDINASPDAVQKFRDAEALYNEAMAAKTEALIAYRANYEDTFFALPLSERQQEFGSRDLSELRIALMSVTGEKITPAQWAERLGKFKPDFSRYGELQANAVHSILFDHMDTKTIERLMKGANLVESAIFSVPAHAPSQLFTDFEGKQRAVLLLVTGGFGTLWPIAGLRPGVARFEIAGSKGAYSEPSEKALELAEAIVSQTIERARTNGEYGDAVEGVAKMAAVIGANFLPGGQFVSAGLMVGMAGEEAAWEYKVNGTVAPMTWANLGLTVALVGAGVTASAIERSGLALRNIASTEEEMTAAATRIALGKELGMAAGAGNVAYMGYGAYQGLDLVGESEGIREQARDEVDPVKRRNMKNEADELRRRGISQIVMSSLPFAMMAGARFRAYTRSLAERAAVEGPAAAPAEEIPDVARIGQLEGAVPRPAPLEFNRMELRTEQGLVDFLRRLRSTNEEERELAQVDLDGLRFGNRELYKVVKGLADNPRAEEMISNPNDPRSRTILDNALVQVRANLPTAEDVPLRQAASATGQAPGGTFTDARGRVIPTRMGIGENETRASVQPGGANGQPPQQVGEVGASGTSLATQNAISREGATGSTQSRKWYNPKRYASPAYKAIKNYVFPQEKEPITPSGVEDFANGTIRARLETIIKNVAKSSTSSLDTQALEKILTELYEAVNDKYKPGNKTYLELMIKICSKEKVREQMRAVAPKVVDFIEGKVEEDVLSKAKKEGRPKPSEQQIKIGMEETYLNAQNKTLTSDDGKTLMEALGHAAVAARADPIMAIADTLGLEENLNPAQTTMRNLQKNVAQTISDEIRQNIVNDLWNTGRRENGLNTYYHLITKLENAESLNPEEIVEINNALDLAARARGERVNTAQRAAMTSFLESKGVKTSTSVQYESVRTRKAIVQRIDDCNAAEIVEKLKAKDTVFAFGEALKRQAGNAKDLNSAIVEALKDGKVREAVEKDYPNQKGSGRKQFEAAVKEADSKKAVNKLPEDMKKFINTLLDKNTGTSEPSAVEKNLNENFIAAKTLNDARPNAVKEDIIGQTNIPFRQRVEVSVRSWPRIRAFVENRVRKARKRSLRKNILLYGTLAVGGYWGLNYALGPREERHPWETTKTVVTAPFKVVGAVAKWAATDQYEGLRLERGTDMIAQIMLGSKSTEAKQRVTDTISRENIIWVGKNQEAAEQFLSTLPKLQRDETMLMDPGAAANLIFNQGDKPVVVFERMNELLELAKESDITLAELTALIPGLQAKGYLKPLINVYAEEFCQGIPKGSEEFKQATEYLETNRAVFQYLIVQYQTGHIPLANIPEAITVLRESSDAQVKALGTTDVAAMYEAKNEAGVAQLHDMFSRAIGKNTLFFKNGIKGNSLLGIIDQHAAADPKLWGQVKQLFEAARADPALFAAYNEFVINYNEGKPEAREEIVSPADMQSVASEIVRRVGELKTKPEIVKETDMDKRAKMIADGAADIGKDAVMNARKENRVIPALLLEVDPRLALEKAEVVINGQNVTVSPKELIEYAMKRSARKPDGSVSFSEKGLLEWVATYQERIAPTVDGKPQPHLLEILEYMKDHDPVVKDGGADKTPKGTERRAIELEAAFKGNGWWQGDTSVQQAGKLKTKPPAFKEIKPQLRVRTGVTQAEAETTEEVTDYNAQIKRRMPGSFWSSFDKYERTAVGGDLIGYWEAKGKFSTDRGWFIDGLNDPTQPETKKAVLRVLGTETLEPSAVRDAINRAVYNAAYKATHPVQGAQQIEASTPAELANLGITVHADASSADGFYLSFEWKEKGGVDKVKNLGNLIIANYGVAAAPVKTPPVKTSAGPETADKWLKENMDPSVIETIKERFVNNLYVKKETHPMPSRRQQLIDLMGIKPGTAPQQAQKMLEDRVFEIIYRRVIPLTGTDAEKKKALEPYGLIMEGGKITKVADDKSGRKEGLLWRAITNDLKGR